MPLPLLNQRYLHVFLLLKSLFCFTKPTYEPRLAESECECVNPQSTDILQLLWGARKARASDLLVAKKAENLPGGFEGLGPLEIRVSSCGLTV